MSLSDDQRQAAAIKATISTYVATAALAILAGTVALFTYISQTFAPPWTFYLFMLLTAVTLVAAIVIGGDGQDLLVARVAKGTWTNESVWQFNAQAVLTLVALVFVIAGTAVGTTAGTSSGTAPDCVAYLSEVRQLARDARSNDAVALIIERDHRTKDCGLSPNLTEVLQTLSNG